LLFKGVDGDQVVEKLAWVVLLEGQMGSWLSTNRFVNASCERKTPANGVVGLDWEGGPLPVGGLSLGGFVC
jgi:hypothetical protein